MRGPCDRSGGRAPDARVGAVVSRFLLEARIGRGAMGTVYRARHVRFGHVFAVKIPHPHLVVDEAVCRRFDREAELAGKLHHRNIVTIVEGGQTTDGLRYLVMDHVEGPTLGELIARGPLRGDHVVRLVKQLCDGLSHAHEAGLVHRDFKPDNVLVEHAGCPDENPRIADFGIALVGGDAAARSALLGEPGHVVGTPAYMAPEQATGQRIDHRVDLFALGVLCFEMLTGVPPFDGDRVEVVRATTLDETPRMAERAPEVEVDPLLEGFTRLLMSKSPADRPASALHARRLLDLIETDRAAAALALGVGLPGTVRVWPSSSIPIPTTAERAPAADPVVASRRGEVLLIALAVICAIAALVVLAS